MTVGPTTTRKQREIAAREELILDVALHLLLEHGYVGLTMDKVAAATEYSKGTVYQHFKNKEDLIAAILERCTTRRAEFFERAATFDGNTRERMGAIGAAAEVYMALFPHHEQAEAAIMAASVREKASSARQESLSQCEFRCFKVAASVAYEAVARGELHLPEGDTVEGLVIGLWSLYEGAFAIREQVAEKLSPEGGMDPAGVMLRNAQRLLDGSGWHPLSHAFDYVASRMRVLETVFPEEARQAGLL